MPRPCPAASGLPHPDLLRGELQHGFRARVLFEQSEPVGERILLRVGRELVDKALDHEGAARHAHAPPPRRVDPGRRLLPDPVDVHGAELVGLILRAVDRVGIDAVLDPGRAVARDDGRARDAVRPGHRLALRVHARADAVVVIRPVHVVLDVFLARPDHLDRPAHLLRDLDRAHGAVVLEAPAEPAAQQMVVDAHLLALQAGELHDGRLRDPRNLRADPDVAAILAQVHGAVHRFHRGVREERLLVDGLDLLHGAGDRCGGVTFMARHSARLFRGKGELADDIGHGDLRVGAGVPLRRPGGKALLRCPGVIGDDGDGVVEADHLRHAAHGLRLRLIDGNELAAERGRLRDRGELHPRQPGIDAELRGSVDLAGAVEAPVRLSDEPELRGLLQGDFLGHRQLRGGVDERSVAELAAAGRVQHRPVLRPAGGRIDLPALRRRRDQHDARRRPSPAQRDVHAANGGRPAGHLYADERVHVDLVVRRRVFDGHLVDIDLQLFGDQHGQRCVSSLAHLDHGRHERHLARAIDAQEGIRRERRVRGERVAHLSARGQAKAEEQTAADGARRDKEFTARGHLTPPCRPRPQPS